jgi:hypothetical protein
MPQWKSTANAAGAPKWSASIMQQGAGAAAKAANNLTLQANVSPAVFKIHGATNSKVIGIFPVSAKAKANTSGESAKIHALGWALRTQGEGQIINFLANTGSGFITGDTVTISNGQGANAFGTLTANATGNLVSLTVSGGPAFVNVAQAAVAFNREKHVVAANLNVTGTAGAAGNGTTINVTVSNTGNQFAIGAGSIAVGSFTSNLTGNPITNNITNSIAWTSFGQFSNNQTNAAVVVTFTNASNGGVVTGLTATANLAASAGGAAAASKLGGRAGRVRYEVLVVDRHIVNGASGNTSNSAGILPE